MTKRTRGQVDERGPFGLVALLAAIVVVGVIGAAVVFSRPSASSPAAAPAVVNRAAAVAPTAETQSPLASAANRSAFPGRNDSGAPAAIAAQDGVIRLAAADFADSKARFYSFKGNTKTIQFFVLRSSDGVIRSAFNACDVCYSAKQGYRQDGDEMICNNCGNRFPSAKINVESGGCNPAPLAREVQGGSILIKAADLEAGAKYF